MLLSITEYNVLKEEREVRTIFVQNLPLDISEREVEDFFESHDCPVRDVQLVVDKQRKFKGLAYVEFYQKESVPAAFLLNGESLLGRPLLIESSNSQKNQSSSSYGSSEGGSYHQGDSGRSSHSGLYLRLYIGNLDYGITQDMLRELLQQFGPIESVRLQTEPNGRSKGHAFVQYYQKDHALAAFHQLNSTPLAGRPLRCDFTKDARARDPDLPPSPPMISGRTTYFPASGSAVAAAGPQQASQAPAGEMGSLDDDVKVSNTSMHNLIQRLAASGTSASGAITAANVIAHPPPQQASAAIPLLPHIDKSTLPNPGTPSTCVCLKNLFDPSLETNPNFDKEIELDVAEEAKFYGPFNHIFVDKNSFVRVKSCNSLSFLTYQSNCDLTQCVLLWLI
jgi:RNA-binding protein 39